MVNSKPLDQLFINDITKEYYLFVGPYTVYHCDKCRKELELDTKILFIKTFSKKRYSERKICSKCCLKTKVDYDGRYIETFPVLVTNVIPFGSVPYVRTKPELVKNRVDNFAVADGVSDYEKDMPRTKDRTVHAGRGSFEGFSIGKPEELLDKVIDNDLSYLKDLQKQINQNNEDNKKLTDEKAKKFLLFDIDE